MISGFKKEFLFFTRGGRLFGLVIAMLGLALSSPIMFGMMAAMTKMMNLSELGEEYASAFAMFTSVTPQYLCASTVEYVISIGSIVMLFIFSESAGGEQKKRSVIIPRCSGLTPTKYVLPKFVIYPLSVLLTAFISVLAGCFLSYAMFGGTPDVGLLLLSGLSAGLYMAFLCFLQFTIGLCTGKPHLAVVTDILFQLFLPSILSIFGIDRYNPMALSSISEGAAYTSGGAVPALTEDSTIFDAAGSAFASIDLGTLNVAVSAGTAVVLSGLFVLVTLFVLSAKDINNEGNDPVL